MNGHLRSLVHVANVLAGTLVHDLGQPICEGGPLLHQSGLVGFSDAEGLARHPIGHSVALVEIEKGPGVDLDAEVATNELDAALERKEPHLVEALPRDQLFHDVVGHLPPALLSLLRVGIIGVTKAVIPEDHIPHSRLRHAGAPGDLGVGSDNFGEVSDGAIPTYE